MALPFTSHITLVKLLRLSKPYFSIHNKGIILTLQSHCGNNMRQYMKSLEECITYYSCSKKYFFYDYIVF